MTMTHDRDQTTAVVVEDADVQAVWGPVRESGVSELAGQYVLATVLVGVSRAGIADRLSDQWQPLARLVPERGDPELVRNTLRFLEVRGILESREVEWDGADLSAATPDGGQWRCTERGTVLLSTVGTSLLGFYVEAYMPVLNALDGLLTGTREYGVDVARDTEALGRRCEPMTISFATNLVRDVLAARGANSVLELGCGTGGLLLHLAETDPDLRAVGLDIAPDAIALAQRRTDERGLTDRVSFVVGDAFAPDQWPAAAADCSVILAIGALHESFRDGRQAVVELLGRYRALLAGEPGRTLLLAEPELQIDEFDADYYLAHVLTKQGFPRPREPWLSVIEDAGLRCRRVLSQPNVEFRFAFYEIVAGE
jgi:SAM-dependent methyltransferase